ncbi:MAG: ABC transporter ATP-binding protein [Haloferacaceae archaeon]
MILEIDGLTHSYGGESAVEDVSFGLERGELVAVLGPSGCGKTTLVQAIAGHVRPTDGRIRLRGEDVTDDPPEARRVGIVFQHSTLFPHLTVAQNVAYGLKARDVPPARREEIVTEFLELVDLSDQREAHPGELSGGQQRRVELARALAPEPDVLLLDEPLSALDRSLREGLREEIARIQEETGVTSLFVTHDQEEAMSLSDRLVVMNDGRVAGIGPPRELYESPPTPFVASFLGRSNALSARVIDGTPPRIEIGDGATRLPVETGDVAREDRSGAREDRSGAIEADGNGLDGSVACHVRPDDVTLELGSIDGPAPGEDDDHPEVVSLPGVVRRVADVGRRYDVTLELDAGGELVVERRSLPPDPGEWVRARIHVDDVMVFDENRE